MMLWISIGGNFSRLNGTVDYSLLAKPVSIESCPVDLNVTASAGNDGLRESLSWWPHLAIYELSYMW